MYLTTISLQNFRNYTSKTFVFKKNRSLIIAPNATGKTNFLEAIQFLSTGEGFLGGLVSDRIKFGHDLARISGEVSSQGEKMDLEVMLTTGMVQGKKVRKKIYALNTVKKSRQKFIGNLLTVAFIPEDLRLITGSPSRRREFFNSTLIQIDGEYRRSLKIYEQTLRRRNRLLQQIREGEAPRTSLSFWNQSLLKHGRYIQLARRKFVNRLNQVKFDYDFELDLHLSVLSAQRLRQYADKEIIVGHTMVGPHKDDYMIRIQGKGQRVEGFFLNTHGSRGQQRMSVLWMKLGAFLIIKETTGEAPVLLLDDIFSELDKKNRQYVFEIIGDAQVIMTTAERELVDGILDKSVQVITF